MANVINIKTNFTQVRNTLRALGEVDDLANNRGAAGQAIMRDTMGAVVNYLAFNTSEQIGVSQSYAKSCMDVQKNGTRYVIHIEDFATSEAEYAIVQRAGGAAMVKQGNHSKTYPHARVVDIAGEDGLIVYYAKGVQPKQRNPRRFGTVGNAYLKYAVTVDQAVGQMTSPDSPENVGALITDLYQEHLNDRFANV
jgi:hypothetical protein